MQTPLTVLVVDDNKADSTLLGRYLNKLSLWEIDHVSCMSGEDALTHIQTKDRDVIFVDYQLGKETGIDVIRLLKKAGSEASFILLTGMGDKQTVIEALREGADDFLTKDKLSSDILDHSLHNVMERRQAKETIRKSEASLAEAQRLAHIGNWNWDIVNDEVTWSDEIYRIFGLGPLEAEASYENFLNIVHPDDRETIAKSITNALNEKELFNVEHRILLPDKTERFVYEQGEVYFTDGKAVRMVGTVQDITERKKVEDKLRLSAKFFETTSEGIIITNSRAVTVDVNDAFSTITGYSREEAIGENPRFLQSGRQDAKYYKKMWSTLLKTGKWQSEMWDRRKDGESYPILLTINEVRGDNGEITHYVAIFSDITSRKQTEERLQYLAHYDPLTDLPNRILFQDRLLQAFAQADRGDETLALMFLDLDRFKTINDSLGHPAGDQLLIDVAKRLSHCTRVTDTVARLGGDEFTIVVTNVKNIHSVTVAAQKIIDALSNPFVIENRNVTITASIGITLYPSDGTNIDDLLKNADVAMYHAKASGKNTYQYYSKKMNIESVEQLEMEISLRRALEREEFVLYYQPQVNFKTKEITGLEALIRWRSPGSSTLVLPNKFIPLMEETGLIVSVGEWVIRKVCEQSKAWEQAGFTSLRIGINLSPQQLRQKSLLKVIRQILKETKADPGFIEFELTESTIMQDMDGCIKVLNELRKMRFNIAIDDFGTGYSSLSYLKHFPIDTIKIDQTFIHDCISDSRNMAIVAAIITMGQSLNHKVIAEGVETEEHARLLSEHPCDEFQGYFYSYPLPAEEITLLLQNNNFKNKLT